MTSGERHSRRPGQCFDGAWPGGAGFHRLFWGGDGNDLLHQAHHVELVLELYDLAIGDPVEDAARHFGTLTGGRDALQLASVRALTRPSLGDLVSFRDQLLEGEVPVRK